MFKPAPKIVSIKPDKPLPEHITLEVTVIEPKLSRYYRIAVLVLLGYLCVQPWLLRLL